VAETTSFGEMLRRSRTAAGLSQEALAERAGLSAGTIRSLEQGQRRAPYLHTVRALMGALNVSQSQAATLEELAARARLRRRVTKTTLPATLTSFVDRSDVDEIVALLRDRRLITLTGCGGIGKTRIAIEVARRCGTHFDAVEFVDLLSVRDGARVASQILQRMHPQRTLLVVDNCEHLVSETAAAVAHLLTLRPATVLATSRDPLRLAGEVVYRLPSMDADTATELFVLRAQDVDRLWAADETRLGLVKEICRELDGIPLAIELAASRLPALGLDGLRAQVARGGQALTGGAALPLRHRTMQAAIAWSYNLLGDRERCIFRRLSVFGGPFTLAAAEEVSADETLTSDDVVEQLALLVQKSLLNASHVATSTHYRYIDAIRAFARERLDESGERDRFVAKLAACAPVPLAKYRRHGLRLSVRHGEIRDGAG
jgi:predicted ATPase/DNA-binding XRE family transcriptional regulator